MNRRLRRQAMATVTAAVFAAGVLGVTVVSPAGAQTAPPPPPGSGVTITVIENPQPVGPLSFT